ncbi:MAG TPA: alpha-amylase family glycosyl hydrolase [Haliangium sp.]|nr:alpha-amylase family glycosyl hydrolase [Haliangium sp.]
MSEQQPLQPAHMPWWQRSVIYQLWLRSYYDTDGDGNGDLKGLIAKLDYLSWLGVDAIWLSPIYPSPMIESGYDVTDFKAVNALLGGLEDFDRLIEEAHRRDLAVILDFVPNHTSDAHPWFQESRASRDNPRRSWYLWYEPRPGGAPPTNWVSCFGGSAWTFDKETGQYYYHAFLAQQPDLNLRNPEVQGAICDAMRFWLARGVDGFRMDAVWHIIKDDQLRDNPVNERFTPDLPPDNVVHCVYTRDRPEAHDVSAMMRRVVDEYDQRMVGGELYVGLDTMMQYYGSPERPELHMPFNLQLSVIPWDGKTIPDYIESYYAALPPHAWPNWAIGTHDASRIVSRAGMGQARLAAMLLLTLRGTPTVYYGDEIGMHDVDIPRDKISDLREILVPYLGLGRDPARTPMQWDGQANAGFTTGSPWLPIADDYERVNVNVQTDDPCGILALYRRLLALRRSSPALSAGGFRTVLRDGPVFVYRRDTGEQHLLVALNFGAEQRAVVLDIPGYGAGSLLLSTHLDREGEQVGGELALRGDEGVVITL